MKQILLARKLRTWPLWLLISGMMMLAGQARAQAPSVTINPTGGNTASDGLMIVVTDTGYLVKKNGHWETNLDPADPAYDRGLRTYVIIEPYLTAAASTTPHYLKACNISAISGTGTAGDPWKVITTSYAPDQDGKQYTFQTILTYVQGNAYFLLDQVVLGPEGAEPAWVHLYLSEHSAIAGADCGLGYKLNDVTMDAYRAGVSLPTIVGVYKDAGDCGSPVSGAHVFKTATGFTSYFAAQDDLRDVKVGNGYRLQDITNASMVPVESKGITVHKAIKVDALPAGLPGDEIRNRRILVGFENSDFASVDISEPVFDAFQYQDFPPVIGFSVDSAGDFETELDHKLTGLKLRISDGIVGVPLLVKILCTPEGADPAVLGADYEVLGSLIIPRGAYNITPAEIDLSNILIKGNGIIEANRTFRLTLSTDCSPYIVMGPNPTATYTIEDDDAADIKLIPTVTTLAEGATTSIKVQLNGPAPSSPLIVTINRGLGNAEAGDYLPSTFPFTVTIPAGSKEATFNFTAVTDNILEPVVDSIQLVATATVGGLPKTFAVYMKITDVTGTIPANKVITLSAPDVTEGGDVVLTAALPTGVTSEEPVTVRVAFSHVTTLLEDFNIDPTDSVDIVIPANTNSITYNLATADDNELELLEEFAFGGVSNGFTINGSTSHIIDDDYTPGMSITLTVDKVSVNEDETVTFTASLPGSLVAGETIMVTINRGAASTADNFDYNYLSTTVYIAPGEHSVTGTLTFEDDNRYEPTEQMILEGTATGFTVTPVTVEVKDLQSPNPALRPFTFNTWTYTYNEGETMTVNIDLNSGLMPEQDMVVTLTATSPDLDPSEYTIPATILIKKNESYTSFDVVFHGDALLDGTKTLNIQASIDYFGYTETQSMGAVTVLDTNTVVVPPSKNILVSLSPAQILEGTSSTLTFTLDGYTETTPVVITLSDISTGDVAVDADFTQPIPTSLTILANQPNVTYTFNTIDDNLFEAIENLRLSFTAAGYTFSVPNVELRIEGDDSAPGQPISIVADNPNVSEISSPVKVTVSLPGGAITGNDMPVTITRDPGSTAGTGDFSGLVSTVTILAGTNSVDFYLTPVLDDSLEITESLSLQASATNFIDNSTSINIADNTLDDFTKQALKLTPVQSTIKKGETFTFFLSLPAGVYTGTGMNYYIDDVAAGSATFTDFVCPPNLTIPPGVNGVSFDVTTTDDGVRDGTEELQVYAMNYTTGEFDIVAVYVEDPVGSQEIAVTVPAASVTEGNSITYTFTLPSAPSTDVTINLAKGTVTPAAEDADFTVAIPASVTILAGNPSATLTLSASADQTIELLEKLRLTPSAGGGYTFDITNIDLDVIDADYTGATMPVTLSFTPGTVNEGTSATVSAKLPGTLVASYPIDITINKGASSTAATADHGSLPTSIQIPAGSNASSAVTVTTATDNVLEAAETLVAEGTVTGFNVVPATLTIDDVTSTNPLNTKLTLTPVSASITEGGSTNITVSLPTGITAAANISVVLSSGIGSSLGIAASDYDMPATVVINAGSNSATFTLTAENDSEIEGAEQLDVTAQATVYGNVENASTLIAIADATTLPQIDVNVSSTSVTEGGSTTVTFTFAGGVTSSSNTVISLAKGVVTPAAIDADFTAAIPTSVTILAGSTSASITLSASPDQVIEQLEKLQLIPTSGSYVFSQSTIDLDIVDNDVAAITLAVTPGTVSEGTSVSLTASLPAGYTAGYDLDVVLSKGAASTSEAGDHGSLPATIQIPAGANASSVVSITTATDDILETSETLVIEGSLGSFTVNATTVTIDDVTSTIPANTAITLTPATVTIAEGGNTTLTVSLPVGITTEVPLVIALSSGVGTTLGASEYVLPASVTIAANSSSATFNVAANTDASVEPTETLEVVADATLYSTSAASTVSVTDATGTPVIDVTVSSASVTEGGSTTITFAFAGGVTSASNTVISLAKGAVTPAAVDADFSATIPTSVTIAAGDADASITLTASADQVIELLEKLQLVPTASGYTFSQSTIDIDVIDNDVAAIMLAVTPGTVSEGTSTSLTASLPAGYTAGYDLDVVLSKGAASTSAAGDHGSLPATIQIAAGANASSVVSITTATDDILETSETLVIEGLLGSFTVNATTVTIDDVTSTIPANTAITLSPATVTIAEGGNTTLTVSLPVGITTEAPLVIALSSGAGTTLGASEYVLPASVTIAANSSSATFNVAANTDASVEATEALEVVADATLYGTSTSATVSVTDATATPVIDVTVSSASLTEGGSTTITFAFAGGVTSASNTVISLAKGAVTPTAVDADFSATIPTSVTIAAGDADASITLTASADQVIELLEKLQLVPTASGYTFSQSTIDLDIVDNDVAAITLAVTPGTVSEGTSVSLTASLPAGYTAGYDLDVVLSKGAASTSEAGDHGSLPATVQIAAGANASSVVSITTATDDILETSETLVIEGSLGSFTVNATTVTIDDVTSTIPANTAITLSPATVTIAEGGNTTLTVSLPTGITTEAPLVIALSSGAGTTMGASEYVLPASVTIAANSSSATFNVAANTDASVEPTETLEVVADATLYSTSATSTVSVTDATGTPVIDVTVSSASVTEGGSTTVTFAFAGGVTSASNTVINLAKGAVTPAAVDADFSATIPTSVTIAAGDADASITLTASADQVIELLEKLQLVPTASGYTFSQSTIDLDIVDNDVAAITLSVTPGTVSEGTSVSLTASLPAGYTAGYDLDVVLSKGAASTSEAGDHGSLPATVQIAAGANASSAVSITTATDDILETSETLVIEGSLGSFTVNAITVTIDDVTSTIPANTAITLTPATVTIAEGGNTTLTVSLPTGITTEAPLVIALSSGAGTTLGASEYVLPASVTIAANSSSTTFNVAANTDASVEPTETLEVVADATLYGTSATSTVSVTDATGTPVIDVTVSSASVTEGGSTTITFAFAGGVTSASNTVISLAKGAVTPVAVDADFSATIPTSVTIAAGDADASITLTASADQVIELLEKLQLVPTASGYTFSQSTIDLDIVDNDVAAITLAVTPGTVSEGTSVSLTASLPAGYTAGYDLDVVLSKGAASTSAAGDHGSLPATIQIPAGANASSAVSITTATDNILETSETLVIEGSLGSFTVNATTVTIDDVTSTIPANTAITLTPATVTIAEGGNTTLTVSLPTGITTEAPLVIALSSGAGTTLGASEYVLPASVTIAANSNDATFNVAANTDASVEATEALEVVADATLYGTSTSATVSVTDATATPVIDVTVSSASVTEGGSTTITFAFAGGVTSASNTVINLAKGAVTPAAVDADFSATIPTSVTIAAGDADASVTLTASADQVIELLEKLQLVPTASGYTFSQSTIDLDIVDNDVAAITLAVTPGTVSEGTSTSLTASLPAGYTAGYDIDVTISKGFASTATPADHSSLPATIRINTGANASAAVGINTNTDNLLEIAETIVVQGAVTGFTVNPATLTINDVTSLDVNNTELTITPDHSSIKEGESTDIWVALPAGILATDDITVTLSRGAGSSSSLTATEYNFPATVTIPQGVNKVSFTLTATADDNVLEANETLEIGLAATVYGNTQSLTTTVTIDDATSLVPANQHIQLTIDATSLQEGNSAQVTVQLPAGITADHPIVINLAAGVATTASAADYSGLPATITINAGDNEVSFTITAIQDNTEEDDETLVIEGTSAGFTINSASILIPGDDVPSYTLLAEKVTDAAEPGTNGRFRIRLSGSATATKAVQVTYVINGTATTGADYDVVSATTVTIPAGANSVDVDVTVKDDQIVEVTEDISLSLQSATTIMNGNTVNVTVDNTPVTVLLTDDESANVADRRVIITKVDDAAEPGTAGHFTVRFANSAITAAADVKVDYAVAGTATAGSDYTALSGSVMIPAGHNSATITVYPINDAQQESAETVIVTLDNISSALTGILWEAGTPNSATLNIGDDDLLTMELTALETSVTEGDPVHFTLKSSSVVPVDMPVTITLDHDAFRNYTPSGPSLVVTIPAGSSSVDFQVNVADNDINDENGYVRLELQPYVTGPTPYYARGTAITTNTEVRDNDAITIIFKQDSVKVTEGNSGTSPMHFTVQLNRRSSADITLSYAFSDAFEGEGVVMNKRRATAGEDFDPSTVTMVIPALTLERDIIVPINGDEKPEANEFFTVKLVKADVPSGHSVPAIGPWNKGVGVIVNDDAFCLTCDTDGDGLTDGEEDINKNLDPTDDDTDNDGIPNYLDLDSDNDGVPDATERYIRDGRGTNDNRGDIRVHPALSPNGDGKGNEVMMIENILKYPKHEVVVMNRFGGVVYKSNRYDNQSFAFKGKSNTGMGAGSQLPDGSYFYVVIVYDNNGKAHRTTGFVVLKR